MTDLTRSAIRTMGVCALAMGIRQATAAPDPVDSKKDVSEWLDRLYSNAASLRRGSISGLKWQETMDLLYGSVPLDALRERLDFTALQQHIIDSIPSDRGELFHRVLLPGSSQANTAAGREPHRVLITKVAHVKKGRSVPPHGHSNMASAFLCLSGNFEVRMFDKLETRSDHLVVRQTQHHHKAGPGTWSSISDYRDNVHWLTAQTDDCFLFTCKLINLEAERPLQGRINIDLLDGQQIGSATWIAPKITSARAAELY